MSLDPTMTFNDASAKKLVQQTPERQKQAAKPELILNQEEKFMTVQAETPVSYFTNMQIRIHQPRRNHQVYQSLELPKKSNVALLSNSRLADPQAQHH
jgi:hypothetical protein